MRLLRIAGRSLWFYRRINTGVLLSVALGTAILVGALGVGDCVRGSLRHILELRLGQFRYALAGGERFFRSALADEVARTAGVDAAAVISLNGVIANSDGSIRLNSVNVLGVDEGFFAAGGAGDTVFDSSGEGVFISDDCAAGLGVKAGEDIVLRFDRPAFMPREAALSTGKAASQAYRLKVLGIIDNDRLGRFGLWSNQLGGVNVFVGRDWLAMRIGRGGLANMLLVGSGGEGGGGGGREDISDRTGPGVEVLNAAIKKGLRLEDLGLNIRTYSDKPVIEVVSSSIFISDYLARKISAAGNGATELLCYFVNDISSHGRGCPYSMVAAIGPGSKTEGLFPAGMPDDGIIINRWLADDIGAGVGDTVTLRYYVIDKLGGLAENKAGFRVAGIIPTDSPLADRQMMPAFEGLADVENCRDWSPGVPIELSDIRSIDQDYWQRYRGTPKAFITQAAGQRIWANRFGRLTAIRFGSTTNTQEAISDGILQAVEPAEAGLFFENVRAAGLGGAAGTTDFGRLFLGFSFFLIISAMILLAVVFVFGIERRIEQAGIMSAVGLEAAEVRFVFIIEGFVVAILGCIGGAAAGLLYTRSMIYGLGTIWSAAVGTAAIGYYVGPTTVLLGAGASFIICMAAIWFSIRRVLGRPAALLLTGLAENNYLPLWSRVQNRGFRVFCWSVFFVVLFAMLFLGNNRLSATVVFFGCGVLMLAGLLGGARLLLRRAGGGPPLADLRSQRRLALWGCSRRPQRSLAVIGLVACGVFLIVAVGASRSDKIFDAGRRDSGTGGFALVAGTSVPVVDNLNEPAVRKSLGLDDADAGSFAVVGLRYQPGDDAGCLNINRAQRPGLLGVVPSELAGRKAFKFVRFDRKCRQDRPAGSAVRGDNLSGAGVSGGLRRSAGVMEYQKSKIKNQNCGRACGSGLFSAAWGAGRLIKIFGGLRRSAGVGEGVAEGGTEGVGAVAGSGAGDRQGWGWELLDCYLGDDVIPAVGDYPTVYWALGKNTGDTIEYVGQDGRPFKIRIVGMIGSSILQGSLIISEKNFIERFGSVAGYRRFLIDAAADKKDTVERLFRRSLTDYGIDIESSVSLLGRFAAVENTYLSIFTMLGGLGLMLGGAGLGLMVFVNVLERRSEFAMMRAVGFARGDIRKMLTFEHGVLLGGGILIGLVSAVIAVWPALRNAGGSVPVISLGGIVAAIAINGLLWVWLCSVFAVRGQVLVALRNE